MIWHGHSLSGCWVTVQVWCYEKQVNKMRFKSYWIRVQVTRMTWRDHSLKWGGLLDYEGWYMRGYSCNLIVPRHVSNLMLTSLWRLRYFIPCFTIFVNQLKQLIRNFSNFASFLFFTIRILPSFKGWQLLIQQPIIICVPAALSLCNKNPTCGPWKAFDVVPE